VREAVGDLLAECLGPFGHRGWLGCGRRVVTQSKRGDGGAARSHAPPRRG